LLVKEAGIDAYYPEGMFVRQQRQGFFEEFHHATGGATVSTSQPAVQ
jgi:hypothetical protein